MDKKEIRILSASDAEIRVKRDEGKPVKIVGYFAKFNKSSEDFGGFREIIEPGFFSNALKNSDVVDLFNHDANIPLGRESATGETGKLKVFEDEVGLRYELTPVKTREAESVISLIDAGVIKGNSFGFIVKAGGAEMKENEDGDVFRVLLRGGCREVIDGSQVIFPAYPDTSVALRSLEEFKQGIENNADNGEIAKRIKEVEDSEINEFELRLKIGGIL